jgi:hypothetical protein
MFTIPSIDVCLNYRHEVNEIQRSFNHNNISLYDLKPIIDQYIIRKNLCKPKTNQFKIVIFFPLWFAEKYNVSDDIKRSVVLSGIYYSEYLLIQDLLIDRYDSNNDSLLPIVANVFLVKSMEILRNIFPSSSYFWKLHDEFILEYWNTIIWERSQSRIRSWSIQEIEMLGNKLSPLKIAAAAFSILGKRRDQIPQFERLIENFHIAMQMLDDIDDWKEDLGRKNFTFFLSECAIEMKLKDGLARDLVIRYVPQLALTKTLKICITYLRRSRNIAKNMNLKSLEKFFSILLDAISNLKSISEKNPKLVFKQGASRFLSIKMSNPIFSSRPGQ